MVKCSSVAAAGRHRLRYMLELFAALSACVEEG